MHTYLLFVTYYAKPGCAQKFVEELESTGTAAKVRAEAGCIRYDYYYSAADQDVVLLFEEWESQHHQQAHLTQPHIADVKAIKEKYILDSALRNL